MTNSAKVMNMNSGILNRLNDEFRKSGGEYVGSMVWLRVSANSVPVAKLLDMILSDPRLPNEWSPDGLNVLKLYLQCMTELGRTSLNKFILDESTPFDKDSHAGYSVHRLHLRRDSDTPTAHRVFHLEKKLVEVTDELGNVIDKKIEDVEVDQGIRILCKRKFGGTEEDDLGTSEFDLDIDGFSPRYAPFVQTLVQNFQDKRNEFYDTQQLRDIIINNILLDKIKALSVTRGVYFIEGEDAEMIEALREGLNRVDPGINLAVHHVGKYPDGSLLNGTFHEVSASVTDSLASELESLYDELKGYLEGDSKTRPSTWFKREQDLAGYAKRVKRVHSKLSLDIGMLDDILADCTGLIEQGLKQMS